MLISGQQQHHSFSSEHSTVHWAFCGSEK